MKKRTSSGSRYDSCGLQTACSSYQPVGDRAMLFLGKAQELS